MPSVIDRDYRGGIGLVTSPSDLDSAVEMESARLDVVLVTYNSSRYLPRLAASLQRAYNFETVVIVDNASTDNSPEVASTQNWGCHHILLRNSENIGFGAAMNLGVAALKNQNEFVLLVNPDVEFEDKTVHDLLAPLLTNPGLGCVGPVLRTSFGRPVSSARALPTLKTIFLRRVAEETSTAAQGAREVGWVCGAVMLLRKSAFQEVGGFSPEFFLYYEDVDLCRKLHDAGYSVATVPAASAIHDQGHGKAPSPELQRYSRRSRRAYAMKWLGVRGAMAACFAEVVEIVASLKHFQGRKS